MVLPAPVVLVAEVALQVVLLVVQVMVLQTMMMKREKIHGNKRHMLCLVTSKH